MSYVFWWPKIARSPKWDHGHDEESRNSQEVKIDILDDSIWTLEWFRDVSDIYRSTEGLPELPGESNGPTWAIEERGALVEKGPNAKHISPGL